MTDLPRYWSHPRPDTAPTLFVDEPADAMAALAVTTDDLRKWRDRGWLSFDIDNVERIDQPEYLEVRFIRSLVVSGLSHSQVEDLLRTLPRPFSFDPFRIAYHFEFGWVMASEPDEPPTPEEAIDTWLDELASEGAVDELEALSSEVEAKLDIARAALSDVQEPPSP